MDSLRATALFGVDAVHQIGTVTSPIEVCACVCFAYLGLSLGLGLCVCVPTCVFSSKSVSESV